MVIDGRKLSHDSSEAIRRMAVKRVAEGEKPSDVVKSYGLCRTSIYRWLRALKRGGEAALASRPAPGRPPKITDREAAIVRSWICGKDPRQYGFDFGLWTRQIVAALIRKRFGKSIGVSAVGKLLGRLGITPQKPLRRAYERDPVAVEKWKQETYPQLKTRAKRCGADIFFLDEAGIRSDDPLGRTWGARGRTPEVRTSGQRQSVNAISAVSALGAFWYCVYTGKLNAEAFVYFLRRFLAHRRRPVFLVVDGHPAHRAKVVAKYVQSLKGRLELHFLPGYAPDLNPDEFVWHPMRQWGHVEASPREERVSQGPRRPRPRRDQGAARPRPIVLPRSQCSLYCRLCSKTTWRPASRDEISDRPGPQRDVGAPSAVGQAADGRGPIGAARAAAPTASARARSLC